MGESLLGCTWRPCCMLPRLTFSICAICARSPGPSAAIILMIFMHACMFETFMGMHVPCKAARATLIQPHCDQTAMHPENSLHGGLVLLGAVWQVKPYGHLLRLGHALAAARPPLRAVGLRRLILLLLLPLLLRLAAGGAAPRRRRGGGHHAAAVAACGRRRCMGLHRTANKTPHAANRTRPGLACCAMDGGCPRRRKQRAAAALAGAAPGVLPRARALFRRLRCETVSRALQ
jgi:hypothetical protein